ncbi:hypothetical protein [Streptomyces sp. NPDC005805]|uniref:hypothetical protein n=1 Tax=Streptomyces sp. NPDC005805 TaxID=3157068 RepID=UPI0033FE15B3
MVHHLDLSRGPRALLSDTETLVWAGLTLLGAVVHLVRRGGGLRGGLTGRGVRAMRVTYRDGYVVGPDGRARARLSVPRVAWGELAEAFEDRDFWLCWTPPAPGRPPRRPGAPAGTRRRCRAAIVTDNGLAIRAHAVFLPGLDPAAEGEPAGGPGAPVDPARAVAPLPHRLAWPLRDRWESVGYFALALLMTGGLITEGAPRPLLTVVGGAAVLLGVSLMGDESSQPPEPRPEEYPIEAAAVLTHDQYQALERLPALRRLALAVPVAAAAAMLVWVLWPGLTGRTWAMGVCLAVPASVLVVLTVRRARYGRVRLRGVARAELARAVPGHPSRALPVSVQEPRRARIVGRLVAVVMACWYGGTVFLLPAGDVTQDAQLQRLRAAGAVVEEARIVSALETERHYGKNDTGGTILDGITQLVRFELPDADGEIRIESAHVRSDPGDLHEQGRTLKVIHAPSAPELGFRTSGVPGAEVVGHDEAGAQSHDWQHYQDDLDRVLAGYALSGRQLALGVCGLLVFGALPFLLPLLFGGRQVTVLAGHTRVLRGTFTEDAFVGGGHRVVLRGGSAYDQPLAPLLAGASGRLCWDPGRGSPVVVPGQGRNGRGDGPAGGDPAHGVEGGVDRGQRGRRPRERRVRGGARRHGDDRGRPGRRPGRPGRRDGPRPDLAPARRMAAHPRVRRDRLLRARSRPVRRPAHGRGHGIHAAGRGRARPAAVRRGGGAADGERGGGGGGFDVAALKSAGPLNHGVRSGGASVGKCPGREWADHGATRPESEGVGIRTSLVGSCPYVDRL